MRKSKKFLTLDTTLEELTVKLIEMGYTLLSSEMFQDRRKSIQKTMEKETERCFYSHVKRCLDCQLESVEMWDPVGKYFLEADFDFSGVMQSNSLKLYIHKCMFSSSKAIELANKFIFGNKNG